MSFLNKKSSIPALIFIGWLVLMTLLPFFLILGMSFLKRNVLGSIEFTPSLYNYTRCFQWIYFKVFTKTLWLAAIATLSCLIVGFPVACFLASAKGWLKQLGLLLLFVPFWTNFILRIFGLISLFGNHGLVNQVLLHFGFIESPLSILYTRTGVYLGLLYNYLPFLVIPIYSSLEKLDVNLREAAFDLGATRRQAFFRVVLPNIREGIVVGSLFVFIPMLGEYLIPDLLGGAKEVFLGNILVSQFFVMQDWPFGSAIAGLLSLFLMVAVVLKARTSKMAEAF